MIAVGKNDIENIVDANLRYMQTIIPMQNFSSYTKMDIFFRALTI